MGDRKRASEASAFKVGILGAGQISRFHLEALRRVPNGRAVAIADLDAERAREVGARARIAACTSLDELIAAGAEVIHVLTPPATHAKASLAALEAGCHVYVEKPLATSVEDCQRIAAAAQRHGRSVCVGHSLLRDPLVAKALRFVESGGIGEPLTVDYVRCQPVPPYSGGPPPEYFRDGGYPFRDLGIHALYLIEAFLGRIRDVHDHFHNTGYEPHLFADEWRILLHCARGTAHVQMSWNVRPQQNLLVVQGTRGVMRVDLFGMSVSIKRSGRMPEHAVRVFNALNESRQVATQVLANTIGFLTGRVRRFHGLQVLVADFYRALADGAPAPVTPTDAINVVEWTERIARRADAAKCAYLSQYDRPLTAEVLVTGAAGLIGRNLVRRLVDQGQRVRALVRREPPSEWLGNDQVEVVLGDLGDPAVVERAVSGCKTVYHVGAAMRGARHDFDRGTVAGTKNVVDSALNHAVEKFIYISSLSVLHALARLPQPVREDWPIEPHPERRGDYTRSKCAAEKYVLDAVRARGLPAIILRPGEVVGRGAALITSGIAQRKGNRLIVLGDGQLKVPMVYIDDLVDAVQLAEKHDRWDGSVLHVVAPSPLTQNEIITRYVAAANPPLRVRYMPRSVVYALSTTIQLLFTAMRRPAPLSLYRVRSAMASRLFDVSDSAAQLGWQPATPLDAAVSLALVPQVQSDVTAEHNVRNNVPQFKGEFHGGNGLRAQDSHSGKMASTTAG